MLHTHKGEKFFLKKKIPFVTDTPYTLYRSEYWAINNIQKRSKTAPIEGKNGVFWGLNPTDDDLNRDPEPPESFITIRFAQEKCIFI